MRVTVQHSGAEIPTCEGNKFAQAVTFQNTVGAQSLARGHIGDNNCQKNKILQNLFLQKIKKGYFSSRFLNKKLHFWL